MALAGDAARPQVVLRARIEMADERLAGSRQPYHEVEDREVAEAGRALERLRTSARTLAHAGLKGACETLRAAGHAPRVAGILDSSGRKGGSLEAILASHALIHTADGDHFRDALVEAAGRCGLTVSRVREKELPARAQRVLGGRADDIQRAVAALGKPLGPPWGADQKSAALLAWMLLARPALD